MRSSSGAEVLLADDGAFHEIHVVRRSAAPRPCGISRTYSGE